MEPKWGTLCTLWNQNGELSAHYGTKKWEKSLHFMEPKNGELSALYGT
jgi:hypothetical protein